MIPNLLIVRVLFRGPKGEKGIPMAIDTGATGTIIPPQVALSIGCDPAKFQKRVAIITASSIEYLPLIPIPEIVGLDQRVRDFEVVCHDLPHQSNAVGLLGLDFLHHVPSFLAFKEAVLMMGNPHAG